MNVKCDRCLLNGVLILGKQLTESVCYYLYMIKHLLYFTCTVCKQYRIMNLQTENTQKIKQLNKKLSEVEASAGRRDQITRDLKRAVSALRYFLKLVVKT